MRITGAMIANTPSYDFIEDVSRAQKAMQDLGLPPRAVFLAALLAEARGELSGLTAALENCETGNAQQSASDKARAICTHLLSLPEFEDVARTGGLLSGEACRINGSAQSIATETSSFGGRLETLGARLHAATDEAEMLRVIESVKNDTDCLVATNRNLCERLRESMATVDILRSQLDEIHHLARTDMVTGLLNRRFFEDGVQGLIKAADGTAGAIAMLFFDVDDFKRFNDRYGHAVGDMVLKLVARIVTSGVRENDLCGRFGGDEFVVALPGIKPKDAQGLAERLRERMAATPLRRRGSTETFGNLTISMGMTFYNSPESLESFISRADSALIDAKKAGKNKLVVAA